MSYVYDVFISHASEDKADFVDPLVTALEGRGVKPWYDGQQIELGDDFRRKMDDGLRSSRFGVVVLSPSFAKYWTEAELSALFQQERAFDEKRILPVVHLLTPKQVAAQWPLLSARAAATAADGPVEVAKRIADVVQKATTPRATHRSQLFGVPQTWGGDFVGRDEALKQLAKMLRRATSVRVAPSLEGMAGIGKTELALQLVNKLAEEGAFPGGIFWLDAENPDLTTVWASKIADDLAVPKELGADRGEQALQIVKRRVQPVLIVLDNVESWSEDHHPSPLPTGVHIRLLITTRQRNLGGVRFKHFKVDFLEPGPARELLDSAAQRDLSEAPGLDDLLAYLDGHALALTLAGAFLGEFPQETPASYLAALRAGEKVDERVKKLVRYERTVDQAFATLWPRLDADTQQAWRVAACFAPEMVTPELSDAVGLSAQTLHGLRRFHLIEIELSGGWRMHRLTRKFGQRAGDAEELEKARKAFVLGCAGFCEPIEISDGFRIYLPNRAHLDAAVKMAKDVLREDLETCSGFMTQVAGGLYSAGYFPEARELFEKALESDLKNLGDEHPNVAIRRSNLALVLQAFGDLAGARELLEMALELDLKNLGDEHPNVAIRRSSLGWVLQDLGDLAGARELLEMALESDLKNFDEEHPNVARDRSILGLVLKDLGDLAGARELLEMALESDLRNLGDKHPSIAIRRSKLATVLQALGDLAGARELLETALESDLKNLGEDHPNVAVWRSNLAGVLQDLGDHERAAAETTQALDIVSRQPEGSRVRVGVERAARGILGGDG